MKRLLITLIILCFSGLLSAEELASIEIITPVAYSRPSTKTQTMKSVLKVGIGDLINIDVVAQVKAKLEPYKKDLAKYFPGKGELDTFIHKTAVEGRNLTIGDDRYKGYELTDAKLINFYEYLGNQLIGGIADKILATEGVVTPERRKLWTNKLLAPFKDCIGASKNALYDASHCVDALSASLVPSIGLGIVYELSRQSLSGALLEGQRKKFNEEQTNHFKMCLISPKPTSNEVKDCSIKAMKVGVLKVTEPNLVAKMTKIASSPTAANTIKQAVWPFFYQCVDKVGNDPANKIELKDQFMNCIDSLVETSGSFVVQDKVQNNSALKKSFNKTELSKLSTDKSKEFKSCLAVQKAKNNRKDGLLDTEPCENKITNELTYMVVLKSLGEAAHDSFRKDPASAARMAAESKKLLETCWDNSMKPATKEQCIRKTVISFSEAMAKIKLDSAISNDIAAKKDMLSEGINFLKSCLDQNLPVNVSEAANLSEITSGCANKLTVQTAKKVAQELLTLKAQEQRMPPDEIEQLTSSHVSRFAGCIGDSPKEETLDRCSSELKRSAALVMASAKIRSNAEGKMSPEESNQLIADLVNSKFTSCLGETPSDAKLDECIGSLTQNATRQIVLAYQKKQIKAQLNTDNPPEELKKIEKNFIECTERKYPTREISSAMDECTKNFALGFAEALGNLKINSMFRSMLGSQGFKEHEAEIKELLDIYNGCLGNLKTVPMNEGLLEKITVCTKELEGRAIYFVSSTVNKWMSSEEKDASTLIIKQEFANFLPCISGILPPSPYSPKLDENAKSILKPVAMILAQYIEYSPEDAKRSLNDIILKLSTDLKDVASNPASREALVELLYANGALDQFLKSFIRSQVKASFEQIAEKDLPESLRKLLIEKENFDKIFSTAEGKSIKEFVMNKMLKPMLVDQVSMSSPLMNIAKVAVEDKVVKLLVTSPHFGEQIIKTNIQKQINEMNGVVRFMARALYGKNAINWEKVRETEHGQIAEAYIKEHILMPKFKGVKLSADEEKAVNEEAEKLVKNAVKKYE